MDATILVDRPLNLVPTTVADLLLLGRQDDAIVLKKSKYLDTAKCNIEYI